MRQDSLVAILCKLATRVRYQGGSSVKCESTVSDREKFYLPPTIIYARYGDIQKRLVETGKLSVFALFPVTRRNKELVEVKPWTRICTRTTPPLKKIVGAIKYKAFSLKRDGLVINTGISMFVNESLK